MFTGIKKNDLEKKNKDGDGKLTENKSIQYQMEFIRAKNEEQN